MIFKNIFRRAVRSKLTSAPHRLPRLMYPAPAERAYDRELQEILKEVKDQVDAKIVPMLPSLVTHFGRVRKDEGDEPDKVYAAFIFDKKATSFVLHCTHHYLGALTPDQLKSVENVIDGYFLSPRVLPRVVFDRLKFFGDEKDVRVLTPSLIDATQFFPDLKSQLSAFREDEFYPYKPHVSTDTHRVIDRPFSHYALITKRRGVIRSWPKTVRMDADEEIFNAIFGLDTLADEFEKVRIETEQAYTKRELRELAKRTGESVEYWNAKQMNGQLKGLVEVDVFGGEKWLAREMGGFVVQNVGLITSIGDEYLNQVEKLIATSVRSGLRVEEIAAEIEDRYDVSSSRATLIARDQIGKFNGQLTELRQKDLGIEGYIWRGVDDARERDSHRLLNDTPQRWDDPPDVGHPGEDYQCRCWGEPDLSEFFDES